VAEAEVSIRQLLLEPQEEHPVLDLMPLLPVVDMATVPLGHSQQQAQVYCTQKEATQIRSWVAATMGLHLFMFFQVAVA
jgi:hypothetical protein